MDLPVTFADFAVSEGRFRKHFRNAPRDMWGDEMIPFHEFLQMDEDERIGNYPYIWGVDKKNQLTRILCAQEIVNSAEERLQYWHQLKDLSGQFNQIDINSVIEQTKIDMASRLSSTLLSLSASGNSNLLTGALSANSATSAGSSAMPMTSSGNADFEPVWVETPECTACDECTDIAPGIFAYNADKQAEVINPTAGKYKDIVRAAEKCTAGCLHPGTPWDMSEKDVDKMIKRAEKYQ